MTNRETLGSVYGQLQQAGYIDDEMHIETAGFNNQNDSPWFIQGLMGCGGWLAAMFTLGVVGSFISLFLNNMDDTVIGIFLLFVGAIFAGITTMVIRSQAENGVFVSLLLLTFHIAGHLMLIAGFVMVFELWGSDIEVVIASIYIILLQAVFIFLYPNAIYRFLAMLMISSALAWIAFTLEQPILTSIFTGILMILAILVWADKLSDDRQIHYLPLLHPIGYGAIIGAFGFMIYEVSNRYRYYYGETPPDMTFITALILFACLIFVLMQLLKDYEISLTSRIALPIFGISAVVSLPIFGISAVVSLPIYATPGILAGVIGILLAFRRLNRILLGISYLYMAGFIIYYYYWLDVSLLTKSIILMTTGVLLIVARLILRRVVSVPDISEGEVE